ncbi:MAG TPA: hypothetical protein VF546_14600 [Pyrinomonadaceae bacterium]|jgi:hypothetical protein
MKSFLKKSTRRLLFVTFAAALLGSMMPSAYANAIFLLSDYGGTQVWLSCGSSAGNYTYTCNASGCTSMYDDPWGVNQAGADAECRDRGFILY